MRRIFNLFLVAAAALLGGCVTTTGPSAGQQLDSLTQSIYDKMASLKAGIVNGSEPVLNNFSGSRIYAAEDGRVQEIFALLPDMQPGSVQNPESSQLVAKIGAVVRANPTLTTYIYVSPADARNPIVMGYNGAIEQIAGRGRVTIKSDARLSVSRSVLVWVTGPESAAQDALLSGEKRGLVVRPQIQPVAQAQPVAQIQQAAVPQ